MPEAKVVSLCDVDEHVLGHGVELLKKENQTVSAHTDMRRVFDDKNVDAVLVALPNHWHALATVWACQAGKDVYVEKPFCHNIWEGRQMIAAARQHKRMVQVGTQSRSSELLPEVFKAIQGGMVGPMRVVHALIYRPRPGIGMVSSPTPVPNDVDYDLWCGPARPLPVMRPHLHYEWHWFWETGNGEIGNNGPHTIDIARWALGQNSAPRRVMSIGGRFGEPDSAETANTQVAIFDYEPAPLICEVRNLGGAKTVLSDSIAALVAASSSTARVGTVWPRQTPRQYSTKVGRKSASSGPSRIRQRCSRLIWRTLSRRYRAASRRA